MHSPSRILATTRRCAALLTACSALLFLVACEAEAPTPQGGAPTPQGEQSIHVAVEGDLLHNALYVLDGLSATRAALATGTVVMQPEVQGDTFVRAGLRFETVDGHDPGLQYRVERADGWSDWSDVTITWHEEMGFNGIVELDAPARRLELRPTDTSAGAELDFVLTELFPDPIVREVPVPVERGRYATLEQGLAPPSFVNLRSAWGARSTGTCGSAHTPTYLTVHHTVTPTNDSMSPPARLRAIQNYHIDGNGWCDIGYHFLVSADGRLWQGRGSHDRSGAHVGGHNTNNVGISFMGSFHIDQVPNAMIEGTAPLFAWFRDNYGIPLTRGSRVFGHREWSGQSTACPGEHLLSRLQEIIDIANGAGTKDDGVDVDVRWRTISGQERNLFAAGSSASIFDMVVGQRVTGVIEVRNGADRPATDDMIIGYWIQQPYLTPVSYTIRTDKPAKDGSTFVDSDQNGRSDNPAADALPGEGFIRVGTVQPGETVRVEIRLEAGQYSFGKVDHPDLRGWVKHIGSYYGEQDSWNDDIEHNDAGKKLRAYAQLDVFSPNEWQFDGPDGDDLEGWAANGDVDMIALNLTDHALAYRATGTDPYVTSPAWTSIDADTFEQIVLRGRQHGGERTAQLFYRHEGEGFAEERSVTFQVPGDGEFDVFELDMTGAPGWNGTITRLRLDSWNGGPYTGAPAWFDVDYLLAVDTGVPVTDADGDGAASDVDCNDADATIFPGADEICDTLDNNCNGAADEDDVCGQGNPGTGDDVDPGGEDDVVDPGDTSLPGGDTSIGGDAGDDVSVPGADTLGGADAADAGGTPQQPNATDASGGCCTTVAGGQRGSSPWPLLPMGLGALGAGLVLARRRRR